MGVHSPLKSLTPTETWLPPGAPPPTFGCLGLHLTHRSDPIAPEIQEFPSVRLSAGDLSSPGCWQVSGPHWLLAGGLSSSTVGLSIGC